MNENPTPDAILQEVLHITDLAERAAYLDRACGEDEALRQQVESLLAAQFAAEAFLDPTVAQEAEGIKDREGDCIGRYKLLQRIGEGGMGDVWMAQQEEPVARKVALKIIKVGMDTGEVVTRFEAERQALALMDHPCIAHVFDGGASESGRPYFVMELVPGVPITQYCDDAKLDTRARLALFRQVCEAVGHAHQKGVIHRDLKPSNILVTNKDGHALPKIIDFGIAKAVSQPLTERTLFTRFGQMLGTPAYMSPEQAQFSAEDVDTRSDIYSLGVLLYELLTGSTPFEDRELRKAAVHEMCRMIREEDPPKPSTRLSTLGEKLATVAAHQDTEPAKLGRTVRGELDWIVMKALEKDRGRRYQNAAGFGEDVERYLDDEAVQAGPPSASYRFKKMARRHKGPLVATVAVALALIAGSIVSSWQAIRATIAQKATETALDQKQEALNEKETALVEKQEALEEKQAALRRSEGLRLAAESSVMLPRDPCLAMLLAIEGGKRHRSLVTNQALHAAMDENRVQKCLLHEGVEGASFSPDGTKVLTFRQSNSSNEQSAMIRLWDAATGRELEAIHLTHEQGDFIDVAFTPNGECIVVWIFSGDFLEGEIQVSVRTWDAATVTELSSWQAPPNSWPHLYVSLSDFHVRSGSMHSEAHQMVFSAEDNSAIIVDITSGEVIRSLRHPVGVVQSLFALNGTRIVTTAADHILRVWDADTGDLLSSLDSLGERRNLVTKAEVPVNFSERFSRILVEDMDSAGRLLLLSDYSMPSGRRVFDIVNGEFLTGAIGFRETAFAFDHDGRRILTISNENSFPCIDIIDLMSGETNSRLSGHKREISSAAFSPDGCWIVSESYGGTTRIWDAENGFEVAVLRKGYDGEFNPDSQSYLQQNGAGEVCIWNLKTGREQRTIARTTFHPTFSQLVSVAPKSVISTWGVENLTKISEGPDADSSVSTDPASWSKVSPDGRCLLTIQGQIQDIVTGRILHRLRGHADEIVITGYAPGGDMIVTGSRDKTARIFDAESGRQLHVLLHDAWVTQIAFSPDGRFVATGSDDCRVRVWELASGKLAATLSEHSAPIRRVVFAPDSVHLASVCSDGSARLWQRTGKLVAELEDPIAIGKLEFSSDGEHLLTCHMQGSPFVRIWSAQTGDAVTQLEHKGTTVSNACFSPDGKRVFTAPYDAEVRVWDSASGEELFVFPERGSPPVVMHPDGEILAMRSSDETSILLCNTADGSLISELGRHEGYLHDFSFSPDGKLLHVRSSHDSADIWDPGGMKIIASLEGGHARGILDVAFSPDGRLCATASGDEVRTWNSETGKAVAMFAPHKGWIEQVAFLDNERAISRGGDGPARIWRVTDGKELLELAVPEGEYQGVLPIADGKRVLAFGDTVARIVDSSTGEEIVTLSNPEKKTKFFSACLSPDGRRILTVPGSLSSESDGEGNSGSTSIARIRDASTGRELLRLEVQGSASDGAFHPNGKQIAIASDSGVHIFDATSGELLQSRSRDGSWERRISYSPDGKYLLVSGGWSGTSLLDSTSAEVLANYEMENYINVARFTPDGSSIITGDVTGGSRTWPVDPLAAALRIKPRELTEAEREHYEIRE